MTMAATRATAEAEIRALIEEWARGTRAKGIDAIMDCYDPEVLAFDAIAALRFQGAEAYRKHWQACLDQMPGAMFYEVHDLKVTARDDIAFCHYLGRCGWTDDKGEEQAGWLRATVCCDRSGGRFRIVHEHYSVPFDPETKQVLDLQP